MLLGGVRGKEVLQELAVNQIDAVFQCRALGQDECKHTNVRKREYASRKHIVISSILKHTKGTLEHTPKWKTKRIRPSVANFIFMTFRHIDIPLRWFRSALSTDCARISQQRERSLIAKQRKKNAATLCSPPGNQ